MTVDTTAVRGGAVFGNEGLRAGVSHEAVQLICLAIARRGGQANDNRGQAEAFCVSKVNRVKVKSVGGEEMFWNVTPSQAAATVPQRTAMV